MDRDAVVTFFDEFVEAFQSFSGEIIARRYLAPYFAVRADGRTDCFATDAEIVEYFQETVDAYHAQGGRTCRYTNLEVVPLSGHCAKGTVTWELLDGDGRVLNGWRESFNISRTGDEMKVFASVDHAD